MEKKVVPTLRERALSMVNDAFSIGEARRLPEKIEQLLATKNETLLKDRTWVFDPGGLSIAVTFEWESGLAGATMCAHLKVVDKGQNLPNRRIFCGGPNLLEGYSYYTHIRILPKGKMEDKVQQYHNLIREQYEYLVKGNNKLTISSSIEELGGRFETYVSLEEPGGLRRKIVFVCEESKTMSKFIDPFIDDSGVSTHAFRRCKTRKGAEAWVGKITRALEKKNEEMNEHWKN